MTGQPVSLTAALASFTETYSPRIVARVNDYDVRIALARGERGAPASPAGCAAASPRARRIGRMGEPARVLLISGSARGGSVNAAALATVAALAPGDATAITYNGLAALPAFNPDHDGDDLPPGPARLRQEIAAADAVFVSTPEYAGTLPGSFKNLLDWTVGGGQLYGKPVAWLNVAAPGRGQGAHEALLTVLGYVGADIIEAACRRVPVDRASVASDGTVTDPAFRAEVTAAWTALLARLGQAGGRETQS